MQLNEFTANEQQLLGQLVSVAVAYLGEVHNGMPRDAKDFAVIDRLQFASDDIADLTAKLTADAAPHRTPLYEMRAGRSAKASTVPHAGG